MTTDTSLLALNASHSASGSTQAVAALAVDLYGAGRVVDLATLDPGALIGVSKDDAVSALLDDITAAEVLLLATPVYRATYSGIAKVVFDLLPQDALRGTAVVLAATAAGPAHYLALDTGGRALVASLGGWTVPTVVYATKADFADGVPGTAVRDALEQALSEARRLTAP
jgi:FMN reductase